MLVETGSKTCSYSGQEYDEPAYLWNVTRFNFKFNRSNIGFFYGSRIPEASDEAPAVITALDGGLRSKSNEFVYQIFRSNVAGQTAHAWFLAFGHEKNDWSFSARVYAIGEKFDPTPIGRFRAALPGDTSIGLSQGRIIRFEKGKIARIWFGVGEHISREAGEPWCKGVSFYSGMMSRSGAGMNFYLNLSEAYEFNEKKPSYSFGLNFHRWGGDVSFGVNASWIKGWNYSRWYMAPDSQYVALYGWMGMVNTWLSFPINDRTRFAISEDSWLEYDSTNTLFSITASLRPSLTYSFTPQADVSISTYFTLRRDKGDSDPDIRHTALINGQIALKFTYLFRPKSRFYLVLNLHGVRPEDASGPYVIVRDFGVAALKIRWAIPF